MNTEVFEVQYMPFRLARHSLDIDREGAFFLIYWNNRTIELTHPYCTVYVVISGGLRTDSVSDESHVRHVRETGEGTRGVAETRELERHVSHVSVGCGLCVCAPVRD